MAGKKRKTIIEETLPNESLDLSESPNGETTEFDFELQNAQDVETVDQILKDHGISNVVYRYYDSEGRYAFSSDKIDYDQARRETRGGNCRMGVFINDKLIRMVPFPLAPVILDSKTNSPEASLLTALTAHTAFIEKAFLAMLAKEHTPQPVAPLPSLADLTSALSNLDNLRGKQESALDLVLKGIELARDLNGETDWKTDLVRMGKETLPKLIDGVTGIMGQKSPQQPSNTPSEPSQLPPADAIKAGIQYLKKKCISGVEPGLIIDWVINNAEEYEGLLRVILNMEFAQFAQYDIEIGAEPFIGWFRALYDGLRSAFSEQNPVDVDSSGSVGDQDNVGSNGKPRTKGESKSKSE